MALLVYVTDQCREDAVAHGLNVELDRFRVKVEETQSTSLFDPFPPPYFVKKKLGRRQGRLIADCRTVGDHAVIVFLTILIRGSRAYETEFATDPIGYGKQYLGFVTEAEVARFVEERTRIAPPPIKPDPSAAEYEMLYGAFSHHSDSASDDLVCETKEWVAQVSLERVAMQLVLFRKACEESLTKEPGLHFVPLAGKPHWGIWLMRSPDRLLLLTPVTETNEKEAELLAKSIAGQLDGKDKTTILRSSRRAYPAFILADDELWIGLEKEPLGNMALSPEESEVLESARRSESPFPLFINGRAGSGKSTILLYLFADLLFFHLSRLDKETMAPPIYLTANGELLRIARSFVELLLRSEATFTPMSSSNLATEHREVLDTAFREFQPHLLSLVPPEARKYFGRTSRVDYARFRRMWMERFGKEPRALREFGPDLSWHIIRSYIKGMSSETFLEPEDYIQLPENQITVTHEAFKVVYDRVWTGWYQHVLEAEILWDDQDLTRYVLDHDLARPTYSAVLCDEAQDFTRLELELLLRLNLFSDRSLRPNDIRRVPFAFAGDQFQTLNPTGFRWDTIKASFVEKFIFELDPARRAGKVDLNYRELKFNYRSTHRIVRFGNHVQALRAALFDLPDLKPQMPWTMEPESLPVTWFHSNDAAFWKRFRDNPGFVVIVPCAEGEEADFVSNDLALREHIRIEEGVPVNVLSAGRAKGCEYPAVIVYGFGAASETNLMSELDESEKTLDPDKSLPIQYFLNRLYVAVSRPKRRLVVVDTDQGFKKLWRCAQDEGVEDLMLENIKNGRSVWGQQIEGMNVGSPEDLSRESAGDPLENALAFEADGLARQDAFLLRQAAHAYRIAGDAAKYRECRARAFEADGNWYDAGSAYFEAGFIVPEGVRCLWRSGKEGWTRLVAELPRNSQIQSELEYAWAQAIVNKPDVETIADLIKRFANRLNDADFLEASLGDSVWRDALAALLQPFIQSKQSAREDDEVWGRIVLALDRVRARGLSIPAAQCAQIYFWAKRYDIAIFLWGEAGETVSADYHKARAAVAPYPDRILSLAKIASHKEIVDSYLGAKEVQISSDQASAISDAFRKIGRSEEAYGVAWRYGVASPMLRLVRPALQEHNERSAKKALHAGLVLMVKQAQWDMVSKFASSTEFVPSLEWKDKELKALVQAETSALQVTLVRAFARSEEFARAPQNVKQQLGSFLRKYLRVRDGVWRSDVSVAEAGAAIERGGRFTDAIAFYEAVAKDSAFGAEDRLLARQRWVVNKQRQLEYEKNNGDATKVSQIEYDMRPEIEALRIARVDDLSEFPALPPLDMTEKAAGLTGESDAPPLSLLGTHVSASPSSDGDNPRVDPSVISAPPFKLEFSRRLQRCNIMHTETMATAFIKLKEFECGGEVEFHRLDEFRWYCELWKIAVRLPDEEKPGLLIDIEQSGIQLRIQT